MPVNELELIRAILGKVNTTMTSEEILSDALQGIKDSFNCLATAIVLVDPKVGTFKVVNSKGWSNEFVKKFHTGSSSGLVQEMGQRSEPLLVTGDDSRFGSEGYTFEHEYAAFLAVPLGIRGKQVGFFYLSSIEGDAFPEETVTVLRDLANLCTLILDHGSLGDKVLSLSNIDPLTGLYTYKFWHEELFRETSRAEKLNSQVALMEIRLNRFKEYNAMHGHVKGDELLISVSEIIRQELCDLDIPCRVGSKWHILLVGEDEAAATRIAERILASLPDLGLGDLPGSPTLSIGLSSYNSGEGEKALISRVEDALREARRKGGDSYLVK